MARVQVSDETWAAYRVSLGTTPVSVALGRLVEREVAARRRLTASDAEGVRLAVDDARIVADELTALIARLEGQGNGLAQTAPASAPSDVLFN
jgi:hypothetical protein